MLSIIMANKHKFFWHLGEKLPHVSISLVAELQADGAELEHIRKLFTNRLTVHVPSDVEGPKTIEFDYPSIPMTTKRGCYWYGDFARTILVNISGGEK